MNIGGSTELGFQFFQAGTRTTGVFVGGGFDVVVDGDDVPA